MGYSFYKSERNRKINNVIKKIKFHWRYQNLILLVFSVIIAYFIISSDPIRNTIESFGGLGYFGSFIAGVLFSYGATTAPAAATLFLLGKTLNPLIITITATIGAVLSDVLIFKFIRDRLMEDIHELSERFNIKFSLTSQIVKSNMLKKIIPVVAGFIMASPLPGELATALFAAVRYESKIFVLYSTVFNFIGILIITSLGYTL